MSGEESKTDNATPEEVKFMKGCFGCCLSFLLFPYILGGLFWLFISLAPLEKSEWHMGKYYLQYEEDIGLNTGHHLLYKVDGEKKEILPHVYGYEKDGRLIYFAAAQGYAVLDTKDKTVDVVLLSESIPKVATEKINYYADLNVFPEGQQEKLFSVPHELVAYDTSWGKDGGDTPIGDGRFQYFYARVGEDKYRYLYVYGLYGDFDKKDTLLEDVTGLRINAKSYVTSPYGCAVIDGLSGTCRVLLTNRDAAPPDYQKDIQVLDSFDQFTPEEQAILLEVEKEGLR